MSNRPGYFATYVSSKEWFRLNKSRSTCQFVRSLLAWHTFSHDLKQPKPSPPLPMKLNIATLQTRLKSTGWSCTRTVYRKTLEPGFLLESQAKVMPEKVQQRPDMLGYMETQFSRAAMMIQPGTSLAQMVSSMTLQTVLQVMGPALMQLSMRKLPLPMKAHSVPSSCLYIDTINSKQALCSLRMVWNCRSRSNSVKQATFSCLALNSVQMPAMYWSRAASGTICSFSWLTSLSCTSKVYILACELGGRTSMIEKFLKSQPLLMTRVWPTISFTMRWSWPPKTKSMPATSLASLMSLYFIMCVNATMKLHPNSPRSLRTITYPNSTNGMYSQISRYCGYSVSIHSSSAKLKIPTFTPPISIILYSSPSASLRFVRLSQMLLSSQGKFVILMSSMTCSKSQSRSWLPKQARSIPKAFSGCTMFLPLNSVDSNAGANASPEKRVSVWLRFSFQRCSRALKQAAPALGSLLSGWMLYTSLKWKIVNSGSILACSLCTTVGLDTFGSQARILSSCLVAAQRVC